MTDDTRILTDIESASRRSQMANSGPGRSIAMCARSACPRAANYGPYCDEHRQPGPASVTAGDLTDAELEQVRAEVDAKAAPLFLLAMDWILRRQLDHLGIELAPVAITLEQPT